MNRHSHQPSRSWRKTVLPYALLLALMAASLWAQQPGVGPIRDFKVPEYYPPPNQNQLKWLCTGSNAVPQGSITRVLVKQMQLDTYELSGERSLRIGTDSCLFDSAQRTASSDGRIQVQTGNGRMTITGTGFLWQGTNSVITISNQVHIFIQRDSSIPK